MASSQTTPREILIRRIDVDSDPLYETRGQFESAFGRYYGAALQE